MTQAAAGQKVRVHYTGKLDDGTVFDSSSGSDPLTFTLGSGEVIPGFDKGVLGLALNESRTVKIPCVEAYGPYQAEMVVELPKTEIPAHLALKPGQRLQLKSPQGMLAVTVTGETDSTITLDGNHPLAGKDLTFDLQLIEILPA
ncbi:MAG: peptidylprolyl isomerase [bacterium]